jgi:hypothetical protein
VAFLATPKASVHLDHLSLARWNLLSLRLLQLLSRCTVLSRWCLASLSRLPGRLSTWGVVGHPPNNLHLLSLWVTRRSSDPPLALPLSLRVMLKSLHGDSSIHQCTKGLIVSYIQLLLQDAREAVIEIVPLLLISVHMGSSILCKMVELVHIFHHSHMPLLQI